MAVYDTTLSGARGEVITNGWGRQTVQATAIVAMTTAMIDNANDDVGLFYLPKGAVVVGAGISATDMDTATSAALAIDIGDSDDENRIFAASTVGQGGTYSNAMARAGFLHKYTAETQIRAYIETAAATGAAGTLYVKIEYFVDPDFDTTALTAST